MGFVFVWRLANFVLVSLVCGGLFWPDRRLTELLMQFFISTKLLEN